MSAVNNFAKFVQHDLVRGEKKSGRYPEKPASSHKHLIRKLKRRIMENLNEFSFSFLFLFSFIRNIARVLRSVVQRNHLHSHAHSALLEAESRENSFIPRNTSHCFLGWWKWKGSVSLMNCISVSSINAHSWRFLLEIRWLCERVKVSRQNLTPFQAYCQRSRWILMTPWSHLRLLPFCLLTEPLHTLKDADSSKQVQEVQVVFDVFSRYTAKVVELSGTGGGVREGEPCRCVVGFISYKGQEEEEKEKAV